MLMSYSYQKNKKEVPETSLFLLQISLQSETEHVCQFLLHEESHENAQRYLQMINSYLPEKFMTEIYLKHHLHIYTSVLH